jgi:hypothetical protein
MEREEEAAGLAIASYQSIRRSGLESDNWDAWLSLIVADLSGRALAYLNLKERV